MKCEISLEINGNPVDIVNQEEFSQQFSLTYSFSDLYEPDKVTDSYSKSITLPGTANNNAIFGHIWKFLEVELYQSAITHYLRIAGHLIIDLH